MYIYVSNESNLPVFFDNLAVTHTNGPVLEVTDYYPFGLTMAGISSKAAGKLLTRFKFNGGNELQSKEFLDGSGLEMYDAINRLYDPQLGRFGQIDKLAELGIDFTPYGFARNNPILLNDPLGLKEDTVHGTSPEVVVHSSKKQAASNQINNMDYRQITGWIDAQREKGYSIDVIQNWVLNNKYLSNYTVDKILDGTSPTSLAIRKAQEEAWDAEGKLYATLIGLAISGSSREMAILLKWGIRQFGSKSRIGAESIKEFKQLINRLSQNPNQPLNKQELEALRDLANEYGGNIRVDIDGIKGTGVKPHAHVEGLGKSVESRHIWIKDGVQ